MNAINVLVLAANKGTLLQSAIQKTVHLLAGKAIIHHVLDAIAALHPSRVFVAIGQENQQVKCVLEERSGQLNLLESPFATGQDIEVLLPCWEKLTGTLLVLHGDVPLIRPETLRQMVTAHRGKQAAATLLITRAMDSTPHNFVLRDEGGRVSGILASEGHPLESAGTEEIDAGIYLFEIAVLRKVLGEVSAASRQEKFFPADCLLHLISRGRQVEAMICADPLEVSVVNDRINLAHIEAVMRKRILEALALSGVTILDPLSTYIDSQVQIGPDTTIYPNVFIEGETCIGSQCRIYPHSRISNSTVGHQVTILDCCVIEKAILRDGAQIGPFARLRPFADIGEHSQLGNFVEVKNSKIGPGTKAMHHSYLGDAIVGEKVNIGAGTITCNYDGIKKSQTIIGDGAFIGSDSQLIAPVTVGPGSYVAAGSSISENVPAGSLAIARSRQTIKEGWVQKRLEKKKP
jgi:bifunctional UDP-N-acetylglucosamine pyrophosphorylase / glucosamine-1-phosphate N-acetyltransferase